MALSAFVMFQVQLCLARFLLPWFGGSPAVWSTSMAFFQVLLTLGYAWAAWLAKAEARVLRRWHIALLWLAVITILGQVMLWHRPLLPSAALRPGSTLSPVLSLLGLLSIAVAVPFFALATNGTLQQALAARRDASASPFRLYALSNAGSLLALLSYPFVVERVLPLSVQAWAFGAGFFIFAAIVLLTVRSAAPALPVSEAGSRVQRSTQMKWVALAAVPTAALIAITSRLTADVAAVPFLWVLPLALYLMSFIVTFESDRWYRRMPALLMVLAFGLGGLWFHADIEHRANFGFVPLLVILVGLVFAIAYGCHGELVRSRPSARHLGRFYLMVSLGGSLGTVLSTFVAPLITRRSLEMPMVIICSWLALSVTWWRIEGPKRLASRALAVLALMSIALVQLDANQLSKGTLMELRNFHGQLQINEVTYESSRAYQFTNGLILHGLQFVDADRQRWPTTYYGEPSGVGQALRQRGRENAALNVGVVGLGAGVLAAYCRPEDRYTFYEIDADVVAFAQGKGGYFHFLDGCAANIVAGDARTSMENERASHDYDVLVIDAFSGDSIPLHLITLEAFKLYRARLRPKGVIAVHVSNQYLRLAPAVGRLAAESGLRAALVNHAPSDAEPWLSTSSWLLASDDEQTLTSLVNAKVAPVAPGPAWTDDFADLVSSFRL